MSDQQDSLHKDVGSLTGLRDTDRGIMYARRIQEKSREKQINFYDVANICRAPHECFLLSLPQIHSKSNNLPVILHSCVGAHRWQRSVPLICRLQPC